MSALTSFWSSRYRDPVIALGAFAALAIFPLFADPLGTTLDFAIYAVAYVIFALGLNIVVGFAGLLDLGYVAFFGIGSYVYAFLASPHFGIHLPFIVILPIIVAAVPVRRLRADGYSREVLIAYAVLVLGLSTAVVEGRLLARYLLPILGLGTVHPDEQQSFNVARSDRGPWLEETVEVLRRLWTEDAVSHEGRHYRIGDATLRPRPVQKPRPPIWFAGRR